MYLWHKTCFSLLFFKELLKHQKLKILIIKVPKFFQNEAEIVPYIIIQRYQKWL